MPPSEVINISFAGLTFLSLMIALLFILPLRIAYLPIMLSAAFMTQAQAISIGGFNFYILRIVILFTCLALIFRIEDRPKLTLIDKVFICWVVYSIVSYTILYGSLQAFQNRLGFAYNAIGLYFIFRYLIRDYIDIERAINILTIVVICLAPIILIEYYTGKNPFSILLGRSEYISMIREGRPRCNGPFAHPILLGTFAATFIPFTVSLWFRENGKKLLAAMGFIAATFITIASGSSGPLMAYAVSIIGLGIWPFRFHIKKIYLALICILIAIHLAMKAPVWYLIARVDVIGGNHGWHRAELIDQAIRYFQEWWLIGTTETSYWMPFGVLPTKVVEVDITNQFILEGVTGGLLKLLLFIAIIVICLREIGRALRLNNSLSINITIWSIGVALFSHIASFISISYYDQQSVFWYFLIAIISAISALASNKSTI